MKNIFFLSLILFVVFQSPAHGNQPKFKRVLVLTGGGFQTGQFLGILDGLREKHGWEPEVVITTCGASLGGLLINGMNDSRDRLQYLKSGFYDELTRVHLLPKNISGYAMTQGVTGLAQRLQTPNPTLPIPQVFGKTTILDVPQRFQAEVASRHFSDRGIRVIMVGSRLEFGPGDVGKMRPGNFPKLYREIFLTDEGLAPLLKGMLSPIPALFPNSAIETATEIHTEFDLGTAARISVADLKYMEPVKVGDDYYAGGFVNLHPYELAENLGEEVIVMRSGKFDEVEQLVLKTTLGFDGNARMDWLRAWSQKGDRSQRIKWIELDGEQKMFDTQGFDPKVVKTWNPLDPWLVFPLPSKREDYAAKVQKQYDWGYERASLTKGL